MNFSKSKLMGIVVEDHVLRAFASILHCSTGAVPFKYLGLHVGGNPKANFFLGAGTCSSKEKVSLLEE